MTMYNIIIVGSNPLFVFTIGLDTIHIPSYGLAQLSTCHPAYRIGP